MVPSTAHTAASVKSSVSKNLAPALNRAAQLMSPKKAATKNSSLSSITSLDKPEQPYVPAANQNSSTGIKMKLEMKQNEFNDSLNDELADCDPAPSEQSGGNIEMITGLSNGYHSGSDDGSQGSLSHDQSSYENLMTRSCSDTTELDLDLQATPSSRQSRYCNWRWQRHHSQGENTYVRSHFRSHSQDNDNYLKAQKEISNKLAKANCHIGQHMYQGSLESFQYVLHVRQLGSQTNQMKTRKEISDFAAKVREISNDNMGGLLALRDDVDIDTAVFNDHNVVELTADDIYIVHYSVASLGSVSPGEPQFSPTVTPYTALSSI
ncbi:adenomatous polyposis coli protein [Biomphalaria pfeifferi]|uniref:Adenomatous polyposis coli protein n=1 Tax=Biomphalaria pfeifferi TaxID=112525 RepID=A0AAD8FLH3_BIOPF|nr:adenomatous polyposis coli protein [Biomphalaria pfeifferi]